MNKNGFRLLLNSAAGQFPENAPLALSSNAPLMMAVAMGGAMITQKYKTVQGRVGVSTR